MAPTMMISTSLFFCAVWRLLYSSFATPHLPSVSIVTNQFGYGEIYGYSECFVLCLVIFFTLGSFIVLCSLY